MKQVEVTILGQVYMLGCPEGGEALLANAVNAVDKEMTTIRDGGKVKARERIAVLAALNIAYLLAEQQAAKPVVNGAPAVANGTNGTMGTMGTMGASQAELDALVRRIDAALGEDGQLL
jgi:cell division protein ZapA